MTDFQKDSLTQTDVSKHDMVVSKHDIETSFKNMIQKIFKYDAVREDVCFET